MCDQTKQRLQSACSGLTKCRDEYKSTRFPFRADAADQPALKWWAAVRMRVFADIRSHKHFVTDDMGVLHTSLTVSFRPEPRILRALCSFIELLESFLPPSSPPRPVPAELPFCCSNVQPCTDEDLMVRGMFSGVVHPSL
mmetsp:Transcript_32999/g.51455  ORF Transcript_32999/g.51455 Transcript_32999/m.51455 type:complete len:140 (-) Transcript_32999:274-693(-)